jgi:hypothetical protein
MPVVEEVIPDAFAAEAEAARLWFTREQSTEFKLTGIVDPQDVLARDSATDVRELQLILCGQQEGQDVCLRERFEIKPDGDGFDVTHLADDAANATGGSKIGSPAPLLDPPAGVRAGWLDNVLQKHSFVVLVFYRGFW